LHGKIRDYPAPCGSGHTSSHSKPDHAVDFKGLLFFILKLAGEIQFYSRHLQSGMSSHEHCGGTTRAQTEISIQNKHVVMKGKVFVCTSQYEVVEVLDTGTIRRPSTEP
jgi:hypothetical protein